MCLFQSDRIRPGVIHYTVFDNHSALSVDQVIRRWIDDDAFCAEFTSVLQDAPFRSFRWETPAMTTATRHTAFEFVLVDAPFLDVAADSSPFAGHLSQAAGEAIIVFDNLGGDARLVVPVAQGPAVEYAHFAAFLRTASLQQIRELWRQVGLAAKDRIGFQPVWLSTAGGGVNWLHVRLDNKPKYYTYQLYKFNPKR